jgi:hypothetical protein
MQPLQQRADHQLYCNVTAPCNNCIQQFNGYVVLVVAATPGDLELQSYYEAQVSCYI